MFAPKTQLATAFEKFLACEPSAGDLSLLLQILELRPAVLLSDGVSSVVLAEPSDGFLDSLAELGPQTSQSALLHGLVVASKVSFLLEEAPLRASLVIEETRLLAPGFRLPRWGRPTDLLETLDPEVRSLVARLVRSKGASFPLKLEELAALPPPEKASVSEPLRPVPASSHLSDPSNFDFPPAEKPKITIDSRKFFSFVPAEEPQAPTSKTKVLSKHSFVETPRKRVNS